MIVLTSASRLDDMTWRTLPFILKSRESYFVRFTAIGRGLELILKMCGESN